MSNPHVVILDDEAPIVALCERQLIRSGFTSRSFIVPIEALAYLKDQKAELLLVDIRMPQMDGFVVITEAQKIQPDMAILVMTGYGTVETAIQALRQGVDGLLLKPFEKDDLLQAVNQALADNQQKHDAARIQTLRPLFAVSESLFSETRSDRLLELILEAICSHLRCNHAAYYAYSAEDLGLKIVGSRGSVLPDEKSTPEAIGIGRVDAMNTPLIANSGSPGDAGLRRLLRAQSLGAIMCIPVSLQNLRGVFYAGRDAGSPPFREADLEMFMILARQAAIALENARLYGELRDYVSRVEESQRALIQAEKLATAGRMTASIAHELNNPLQAVQNCLHLAARNDLPAETRQKYFEMTQLELERLMSTVQRMLDFYRPNAERQPVQIIDLLDQVIQLMSSQLNKSGIRVTTSWPSKIPTIMAVSNQLQQVFINIILNAFDAMPNGGELAISVSLVDSAVEIAFTDSGPGVAPEILDDLFEPFSSTKLGGTGLGLSVSYEIISAHGGELELDRNHKDGSRFRIRLPAGGKI